MDGAGLEEWRRSLVPTLGAAVLPRFKAKYKTKKCNINELNKMKSKKVQLTPSALYNLSQGLPAALLTKKKRTITKNESSAAKKEVEGQLKEKSKCDKSFKSG